MFWNKKEMKKLPDLPPIQSPFAKDFSSDEEDSEDNINSLEKHSLPSFPDSPIKKGFSQAAIKDAVENEEIKDNREEFETIGDPLNADRRFGTVEMEEKPEQPKPMPKKQIIPQKKIQKEEYLPPPPEKIVAQEIQEPVMTIARPQKKEKNEIFVKIEKFQSARKSLDMISSQINEIDDLLKKIRETKLREEQELSSWEKEITTVKSKIEEVTELIFEKA